MRTSSSSKPWLAGAAGVPILALVVLCLAPFAALFAQVLGGPEGALAPFRQALALPSTRQAILNTVAVASLVTIASVASALPLAWLLSRTDLPGRRRLRSWLSLPYAIPPYVGAIAWIFLANPTTGLLNHLAAQLFGTGFINIYSLPGLVFVESSFLYTFVLLTSLASFDRMDSSLEEAARLSGASPWRVFTDISLPILRPALVGGALLVFLATAASFGVPALLGGPARLYLVTTQIYTFVKMGSTSGLLRGAALSSLLMIAAVGMLVASQALGRAGSSRDTVTVGGKSPRPSLHELGAWRTPLLVATLAFFGVVFVLPVFGILLSSLSRVQGVLALDNLTLVQWTRTLLEVDETGRAILNSLVLAAGAATAATALGLFLAYIQVRTRLPGRGALELLAALPYATPGTVVALAMIIAFSGRFLGVVPSLYNTLTLIGIAYLAKYLSFAVKTAADGYRQIDGVLAEAARVSGASWMQVMRTIWLPLLRPALVASWFLVFMPAMSELSMTVLLTGPGLETIGTLIFQLQEYADAGGGGASVLGLVVIITMMTINQVVKKLSQGAYGL